MYLLLQTIFYGLKRENLSKKIFLTEKDDQNKNFEKSVCIKSLHLYLDLNHL